MEEPVFMIVHYCENWIQTEVDCLQTSFQIKEFLTDKHYNYIKYIKYIVYVLPQIYHYFYYDRENMNSWPIE